MTNFIPVPRPKRDYTVELKGESTQDDRIHLLQVREIHAINAALAAGRPLLVRGEPGVGKSQLARAAAKALGRVFVKHVIDSHTESRDLMWTFDAVKRLAEAQLAGALRDDRVQAREDLAVNRFLSPGPLWWSLNWETAKAQAKSVGAECPAQPDGGDWKNGTVLLLDEIDKAETEVPNGLLEVLGAREFTPLAYSEPVRADGAAPLVIITTNEERVLPDAFLRRCLVLQLALPEGQQELIAFLIARGRAHFPQANTKLLREAAEMLYADRESAIKEQVRPFPGQAEYLDLLRAVLGLSEKYRDQKKMLSMIREYTLRKQSEILATF